MGKEKVYLETSVISYLTARPSRDVVKLAKQQLTREWWETSRLYFELYVSTPVLDEIRDGDPGAAQLRMESVAGLSRLNITVEVDALHRRLLSAGMLPEKAALDALHIALAAVHGMEFLLTWNCAHINNTMNRNKITEIVTNAGYTMTMIGTPEELLRRG